MNDLTQSSFDYAALPVDSAWMARTAAERIKLRLKRTVEDIIEIGRELMAVKDELPHGQFLPWIAAEFEMSERTAYNFMDVAGKFADKVATVANFSSKVLYALSAPSTPESVVTQAIEKAESGDKVTVADIKDWKAELDAERQAREAAERRNLEWREQEKAHRKKIKALEQDLLEERSHLAPEPIVQEVIPADYETAKAKAAQLETELARLQKEQTSLVNDQVRAKLRGYQNELDEIEQKKKLMEQAVDGMKNYMASMESDAKRAEVHRQVIDGVRLELIGLASFLNDMDPIKDQETIRRWMALANMCVEAAHGIRHVFGPECLELTLQREVTP